MTPVRNTQGTTDTVAALSEIKTVAHCPADSVIGNPLNKRSVNTALQNQILNQTADGVVCKCGYNSRTHAETSAQPAGYIVFAPPLPTPESCVWYGSALHPDRAAA